MRLGIAVWDDQVSPLLDAAGQILATDIANGSVVSQKVIQLPLSLPAHRVASIRDAGINVIICGALSRHYESMLQLCNIKVVPWVRGSVSDVLAAYLRGELDSADYCLPGRRGGRGRGRRGGVRRRARLSRPGFSPEEKQ